MGRVTLAGEPVQCLCRYLVRCKQSDGATGFPPVAWSVAGPFIQRKSGHIKKKSGEKVVEGKIEWDLA